MRDHGIGKGRWARVLGIVGLTCLVALTVPTGCSKSKTSDKNIEFVDPDEAISLTGERKGLLGIGKKEGAVWLDSRTEAKYIISHIPGAIYLPYEDIRNRHGELSQHDLVIVYGDDYNSPDAIGMSKTLIELGHDVRTLKGGLRAWEAAGNELESGSGS